MKRMTWGIALLCLLHTGARAGNTNEPVSANAVLKSVVIYRSGAELTHTLSTVLSEGNVELAVDRVSTDIDPNSVQIHLPSTVTLLGFSYVSDYLAVHPKTPRQQQLEDSLGRLAEAQDRVQLAITNNDDLLGVLKKNQELKGTQTGMNVADLQKLMDYYRTASGDLTGKQYDLKKRYARLGDDIARIKDQIQEEETQNTKAAGRLLLRLSVKTGGSYDFTLSYITTRAAWTPAYEIQVGDARDSSVKVVYKANISQTTGLDWKQVKVALSTSVPGNWSQAPEMNPWFVAFQQKQETLEGRVAGVTVSQAPLNDVVVSGLDYKAKEANTPIRIRGDASKVQPPMYIVDGQVWTESSFHMIKATDIATVNVVHGDEATSLYGSNASGGAVVITLKKDLADYTGVDQQRLNTVYNIDLPYDLPSTGKDQTASLQVMRVKALFSYFAVPKLSDDVYLLADIPDWGKLNLLPGQANIVLDGTYVGLTSIDPSSTRDTLHLTVGKDKRITLQRRKLSDFSSEKFLNANHFQKIGRAHV